MESEKLSGYDFQGELSQLILKATEGKTLQLDAREVNIAEREKLQETFWDRREDCQVLKVRVGSELFYISSDICKKNKDSYFSGLFSSEFLEKNEKEEEFFIPRSPEPFRYVLEFLNYDRIASRIPPGVDELLELDADYYFLPKLKEYIKKNYSSGHHPIGVWEANTIKNKSRVNWDKIRHAPPSSLVKEASGDQFTIVEDGLYRIGVRITFSGSSGNNVALAVDGTKKALAYCSSCSSYNHSPTLEEVLPMKGGQVISILPAFNNCSVNGYENHSLTIERL